MASKDVFVAEKKEKKLVWWEDWEFIDDLIECTLNCKIKCYCNSKGIFAIYRNSLSMINRSCFRPEALSAKPVEMKNSEFIKDCVI